MNFYCEIVIIIFNFFYPNMNSLSFYTSRQICNQNILSLNISKDNCSLTDCSFTEFLVGDLIGQIGSHQHRHDDAQFLSDDIRDEFQSIRTFIHTLQTHTNTVKHTNTKQHTNTTNWSHLYERHPHSVRFDVTFDGVTNSGHKLMRNDEDEDVCVLHSVQQLWNSHLKKCYIFILCMWILYNEYSGFKSRFSFCGLSPH